MTLFESYKEMKEQYPNSIILFRCGDFYETYGEDAIECSRILGITLTHREDEKNRFPLAGFPFHSLDAYLPKLVRAGKQIAICDQPEMNKPTPEKGACKTTLVTHGYYIAYFDTTRGLNVALTKNKSKAESDYTVTYSLENNVLTLFKDGAPLCIATNFVLKFV